jgi:hypothetical protein
MFTPAFFDARLAKKFQKLNNWFFDYKKKILKITATFFKSAMDFLKIIDINTFG